MAGLLGMKIEDKSKSDVATKPNYTLEGLGNFIQG
jgi:hypothetical protein